MIPPAMHKGARIPRVTGLIDVWPVGEHVPHGADATGAVDNSGRRWVRKREENVGYQGLLAEALSWLLARRLGAPVPDGAVCLDPGQRSWLSAWVADSVHWRAESAEYFVNPDGLGSVLALDALVHNGDRHSGNLLLEPRREGILWIWAIDFGNALVGHASDLAAAGLECPSPRNIARGLPIRRCEPGAMAAAVHVAALPHDLVASDVAAACAVANADSDAAEITRALARRFAHAEDLVQRYLSLVEAVR